MAYSIVHHQFILFLLTVINCSNFLLSGDPDVLHVQHHRKFLKEHVVFKEVMYHYVVVDFSFFLQVGVRIGGEDVGMSFFLSSRSDLFLLVLHFCGDLCYLWLLFILGVHRLYQSKIPLSCQRYTRLTELVI